MSCFFFTNTYFQNSFMGEAVFLLLSQKHEWYEAEKSSLLQLSPSFLSPIYTRSSWQTLFPK